MRIRRLCDRCGRDIPTTAGNRARYCSRRCQRIALAISKGKVPRVPVGLEDGHWAIDLVRRVQVWIPDPPWTPPPPPVVLREPTVCGTERGYQRHRTLARKGAEGAVWPLPLEDSCGCRAAHAANEALRKATIAAYRRSPEQESKAS